MDPDAAPHCACPQGSGHVYLRQFAPSAADLRAQTERLGGKHHEDHQLHHVGPVVAEVGEVAGQVAARPDPMRFDSIRSH